MRGSLSFAAVLACAVWVMQPHQSTASTLGQAERVQYQPQTNCREFTATVIIGGQPQRAFGYACPQPDGTWRITESTPDLPPQAYSLPPQAIYAAPYPYPYYWADSWAGPPFFVVGSVFFADSFHRFHNRAAFFHHGFRRDGFRHDGFRHDGFRGGGFRGDGFRGGGFRGGFGGGGGFGGRR